MNVRNLLLLVVAASMLLPAQGATDLPEAGGRWLVLERTATKFPEIVTLIRELPAPELRAKFHVLLQFAWGYDSLPNGMPTEEEVQRGKHLYTALDRIIGAGGVYAMSRTGDGGRTMYYYVENPAAHGEAIRRYFDSLAPLFVRVTAREEPGWDSVREVLGAVK